jgi:hypothetical protein
MIALFSLGSWVSDEVAAAASFLLSLGLLAMGLLTSGLVTTGRAVVVDPEVGVATAVPGVAAGWEGTVAAADVVAEPVAEFGTFDCV